MQLSEHVTQQILDDAVRAGAEAIKSFSDVPFAGATFEDLTNFNSGLAAALQSVYACKTIDELIITLLTLQAAANAKIALVLSPETDN